MSETPKSKPDTCEACGKAPATVHVRRVSAGEEEELHLCQSCAQERGVEGGSGGSSGQAPDPVALLFKGLHQTEASTGTCPGCGMSYSSFRETGRLGCAECYRAFAAELKPLIRRVHGEVRHVGKVPVKDGEIGDHAARIRRLNDDLERAITAEEYERAAEIRDLISDLESAGSTGGEKKS